LTGADTTTGGVVGTCWMGGANLEYPVTIRASFWDKDTSKIIRTYGTFPAGDASGARSLPELGARSPSVYESAGWSFSGLSAVWKWVAGSSFPRLGWEP
jgi:hypothetical protein